MNTLRILAAVAIVGFVLAAGVQAKEKDSNMPPKEVTVKGKVEVTKDASGAVTAVMIKTWDMKYHVTMDAKGMELSAMEGKHVEAKGTVEKKEHQHWLTVTSFEEKAEKKDKEKKM